MKSSYYLDLLRGRAQDLPDVRSKIVRVFVSSTFTDTLAERDSLIENIFPKLKDYCRAQYGLEFQYADMRWGIQSESANNHSEVSTCLKEIELCKKYSVATNFVVLLSHRYGSRPIPAQISAILFELLKENVHESNDIELLSQWYQLDTNCIPPAYILQNISSILPKFLSQDTNEFKQADKEWKMINNRLRICLRQAAKICLDQELITRNDYDDFFISITEKEVINGILSSKDANERTLCFLRDITDIREHLSDDKAGKYIDMISPGVIDEDAENLLNRLKNVRIPSGLRSDNVFKYRVRWSKNGITRENHSEYLDEFNNDFHAAMIKQIDRCVQSRLIMTSDSLQHEILEHAIQCRTYVTKFHGRIDVLAKLEKYVKTDEEYRPCVVYGESGCGKTSVLAKTATEVFKWWSDRSVSVILRFLGTTPLSSTIYKTLLSISTQISEIYHIPIISYSTVNQLRDQLELNLFPQIPDNEYLVLLLDSIDQLHSDAYDCKWLPLQFPSNVKCIISTLPDHGNIYNNLERLLQNKNENLFIQVPPFEPTTIEIVYNDWLKMKNRSLSNEQRLFINNLMIRKKEILPLFMKLVFDIISTWHSYDPIDERLNRLKDVDDCIRYLFKSLEIIHNSVLFSRALCYMTACRSGISQNELEDVLSLDDDVLKSVFQHYIPPVRRVPGILWTRIRNDLDEYITEKEVDDAPVIYWYHRRFIEVARELYIANLNDENKRFIFQNVVDLFKETWKGKNKPFKVDKKLMNKYQLNETDGEIQANRFTTSQPVEFIDIDGRIQYNKRKLNELPQFLQKIAADISLPIAAEEIFFNYSFMHAKYGCSSFLDISGDFDQFINISTYKSSDEVQQIQKELSIVNMTNLVFGLHLNEYPDNYAFEITSRLLTLYGYKPYITKLIQRCDELSPKHCALIVPYNQLQPPGNGLIYSMNKHTMPVVDLDFTENQSAAISLSNKIIVINMRSGNTAIDLYLPKLNEPYLNSTTIPKMNLQQNEQDQQEYDSDGSNDSTNSDDEKFKNYLFFVNSLHHVYLISSHGDIKFHRTSDKGYCTVEVLNRRGGLCLLVERNSQSFECWNVVQNKLISKIDLSMNIPIKQVLSSQMSTIWITVILINGMILFYSFDNTKCLHRGTINMGKHLDLVIVDQDKLICTFDSTISIDFAHIDLNRLSESEKILSDKDIMKTLISFNPSINPKPIKRIVLPDGKNQINDNSIKIFFMVLTKESLYIVHICRKNNISYVHIPGQYDIVSANVQKPNIIFTGQRGIVNMFKWKCSEGDDHDRTDTCDVYHQYQLFISIDISSSPVLTIRPANESGGLFLCSMENGAINAYHSVAARQAFKNIPPFPRTTELIHTIQLSQTKAVTFDVSKQELTVWSYQQSTTIESKRQFSQSITIVDSAILDDSAILIITNTFWAEIYGLKSIDKEPLFRLHLRYPTRVFVFEKNFLLLTTDGSIRCLTQQITKTNMKFTQTSNQQLQISCSKLYSTLLILHSKVSLVILDDNQHLIVIWSSNEIISMNIDLSSSSNLIQLISTTFNENLFFYFENKSLVFYRIDLLNKNISHMKSFDMVDRYAMKKTCLATILNNDNQLNLYDISTNTSHVSIQLENLCEQLCLNESGDYVFALVKPRIICMYRIKDHQRLGRLFVYDTVTTMIASQDFIILGMNDRRLLTLMIADPDDPNLQSKIRALSSRNLKRNSHSAGRKIVEQVESFLEMSSDDYDSDIDSDENSNNTRKIIQPITSFRYVHHLHGKLSLTKMHNEESYRMYFLKNYAHISIIPDTNQITIDDSDSDDDDNNIVITNLSSSITNSLNEQVHNLDDLRAKSFEYDQQQIKGIQLANAGVNNLKITNNYSITSTTCTLM